MKFPYPLFIGVTLVCLLATASTIFLFQHNQYKIQNPTQTTLLSERAQEFLATQQGTRKPNFSNAPEPLLSSHLSTPCYSYDLSLPSSETVTDPDDICILRSKLTQGGYAVSQRWAWQETLSEFSGVKMRTLNPDKYVKIDLASETSIAFNNEGDHEVVLFKAERGFVVTVAFTNIRNKAQFSPDFLNQLATSIEIKE